MKKPCNYPGCPALIEGRNVRYCERHQASATSKHVTYNRGTRKNDPRLAEAHRIRKSARWGRVRRLVLSSNPLCADPFKDHERADTTQTAVQVHHIEPLQTQPHLAFTLDNLMPVCTRCHSRLEREAKQREADNPTPPAPPQRPSGPFPGWI